MVTDLDPPTPHPAALADALDRVGWSARDLVKAVNPRLCAMGQPPVDPTAGYKWLRGHLPRSGAVRTVVALVLTEATGQRYTSDQLWGTNRSIAAENAEGPHGPLPSGHDPRTETESAALTDALDHLGWSARDLVRAVNPRLCAMGCSPIDATAGYWWVRGGMPRSAAVRDAVALVLTEATGLRYTAARLWGLEQPTTETAETADLLGPLPLQHVLRTASRWTSGAVEPALVHSAPAEHFSAAVWDATRQPAAPPTPGRGDGDYVAPEFADMLDEQLAALRRLDDRTGGSPLSQRHARMALHESLTLIHTGHYDAPTGTRLLRHAASAAQLAGWMSFDAGLGPAGHRYQLLAIRIARAAGDTTTVSNALGMLAYQHAAAGSPSLALRLAHAAVEHSAKAVPLVQARAWGRLATAHACAGDLDGFRRATDRCRRLIGQRHSDDPPSLYYFTPQQVDAESGQALVELAAHTRRRRSLLLTEAAQLLHPIAAQGTATGYRRSGLLHGIHLVRASIGARDAEATAHWITALAPTLPQVQSIRCRTLLAKVRTAAGRQLRAAGHGDALDALHTALSKP